MPGEGLQGAAHGGAVMDDHNRYRYRHLPGHDPIRLRDDGYRIEFQMIGTDGEWLPWAEYKSCPYLGPASKIADALMLGEGAQLSPPHIRCNLNVRVAGRPPCDGESGHAGKCFTWTPMR